MKKGSKRIYISSFILIGTISFLFFSGYLIGLHKLPSYGFFRRVELNVFGRFFERVIPEKEPEYYDSIFLRLSSNQADISDRINRPGRGGGLTSFGDAVLLLSHDGQIFTVYSANDIRKANISVPDNGFSAYKRIAESDQYKDLGHKFKQYRYNDILYYESKKNRGLAISYTDFDSTNICYRNAVAILPIDSSIKSIQELSAQAEDWDVIYRSQPCLRFKKIHYAIEGGMAGARMAFRAPSTIFIGNGDYHWDGMFSNRAISQNPKGDYGKMMSINIDSRESRIIASGLRNPQGIVLDEDSTLWIAEHGMRGGDELNRIEVGSNYGWPIETLGTQYSKLPVPGTIGQSYGRHTNFNDPVFAWVPSVAISSLTLIKGFHSSWNGDFLMGSLKSMSLFHVRIKNNRALFSEKIKIGERIRYVHQHTDGRIILWTDSKKLIFLTGKPYTNSYITNYLEENISDKRFRNKIKTTINSCRKCHSIQPEDHTTAPSLASLFKSGIASTDYKNYSEALKKKNGIWTRENLKKFLKNPDQFAPGTQMPDPGINDDATLEEIINILADFKDQSRD